MAAPRAVRNFRWAGPAIFFVVLLIVIGVAQSQRRGVPVSPTAPRLAQIPASASEPRSLPRTSESTRAVRRELVVALTADSAQEVVSRLRTQAVLDEASVLSLRLQVEHACRAIAERDIDHVIGPIEDPERDPARRQLAAFCRNYQADEELVTIILASHPYTVDQTVGREAAVMQAREWLATRDDAISLGTAAEFLLSTDHEIRLPGPRRGDLALGKALHLAALRRECRRDGGCRAEDFRTVAFCAREGCADGADLERALRESVPARDWATITAVDAWYGQQRRGH